MRKRKHLLGTEKHHRAFPSGMGFKGMECEGGWWQGPPCGGTLLSKAQWHRGLYLGAQKQPRTGRVGEEVSQIAPDGPPRSPRSRALRKAEKENNKCVGREEVQEVGPGGHSSSVSYQERGLHQKTETVHLESRRGFREEV